MADMKSALSPKQVARAIGVSESSLKRWCDQGLLPMVRTAGGHRRLPIAGVLDFLKETGRELAEPEVLGLPSSVGSGARVLSRAGGEMAEALISGNEESARRIVLDLFLQGHRLAVIFDEVVASAFRQIGDGWECGSVDVYQERRACEIMLGLLRELKQILPGGSAGKTAIGATPSGDPYQLPTNMVALVLAQCGYAASSLGANIPCDSLSAAIGEHQSDLFWLSVSHVEDREEFVRDANRLFDTANRHGVALVVGGRALDEELRRKMHYTTYCDTLQHLEFFLGKHTEG